MNTDKRDCQIEQIATYLDGELDEPARLLFEAHIEKCLTCGAELSEQRRLLCALESVLSRGSDLPLPTNFAQIVAAHAESDMSGMRERREHGRALRLSLILAAVSFALLGVAARAVLGNMARTIWRPISAVFDLVWSIIDDAFTGVTIISRVISKGFIPGSHLIGLLGFSLLALAVLLLSRLVTNYHRTRLIE